MSTKTMITIPTDVPFDETTPTISHNFDRVLVVVVVVVNVAVLRPLLCTM